VNLVGRIAHRQRENSTWLYEVNISVPTDRVVSIVCLPEHLWKKVGVVPGANRVLIRVRTAQAFCQQAIAAGDEYRELMDTVARKLRLLLESVIRATFPALYILLSEMHGLASILVEQRNNNGFSRLCGLFDQCLLLPIT